VAINVGKSACMRIDHDVECVNIRTVNACKILWCDASKYLRIIIVAHRVFKCLYGNTKCKFYKHAIQFLGKLDVLPQKRL